MKLNFIKLLRSKKTVFTIDDLKKILDTTNEDSIRNYFSRAKKQWLLQNIYYGIRKLVDKDVVFFELACKIKTKSYVSLETVLKQNGVVFQHYGDTIFLVSDNTVEKNAIWKTFSFHKIKSSILLNPLGIEHKWNYSIASTERAICDRIYLNKNYYFDDLSGVDLQKLEEISQIYNKRVILDVKKLIQNARQK